MPYIAQEDRNKLDDEIDKLANAIVERSQNNGHDAAFAGYLNYSCTRLVLQVLRKRFGKLRYWMIAATTGALQNISDEFYRRVAVPYEDRQIAKSGDVDEIELTLEEIGRSKKIG